MGKKNIYVVAISSLFSGENRVGRDGLTAERCVEHMKELDWGYWGPD